MAQPRGLDRATFVFTDIVDSTLLWETCPAEMALALARHDELIADVVDRHGGVLLRSKGEGDSTVSVFATAADAVHTAAAIQRALGAEAWPPGAELRARIGVQTGDTHQRGGEYFGPTLNRGARLRAFAAAGEIAVSQATVDESGDNVDRSLSFVDLGPQALRGLLKPEHIYVVAGAGLRAIAGAERDWVNLSLPAALEPVSRPSLVGRDVEVGELASAFVAATMGTRRLALIGGEPGVGKTALAARAATGALTEGAVVLFGRCDEGLHAPYQPFIEALRHYVESCPVSLLARQLRGVESDLARLLPVIADLLPGVAPSRDVAVEDTQHRMFEAVDAFVTAIARLRPVVLVLDDLHWATATTLALLRHLMQSPARASLLVIGTYRDAGDLGRGVPLRDALGDLHRLPHVTQISLRPLAPRAVAQLVDQMAGLEGEAINAEVARVLHARTAGNAFYLTELVHHLVASKALELANAGNVQRRIDNAGLPEGVRAVVRQRLSALSEQAENTLAAASVLGTEFSFAELERSLPDDLPAVIGSVEEAIAARLVVESDAGRFAFAHSLVRDTLYEDMSPMRRMALHRAAGEMLEAVGDRRERVPEMAFHFSRALALGGAAKAVDYALIAGNRAISAYAFDDAVSIYDRGLAAYDTLAAADRRVRILLLLGRARAHQLRGAPGLKRVDALAALDEARACGDGRLLAVATNYLGWLPAGDREGLHRACVDALAMLGDDEPAFRAMAYNGLADEELQAGSVARCLEFATHALALVRGTGDTAALISTLGLYSTALIWSDRPEERRRCADELLALESADQAGLPVAIISGVPLLDTTGATIALSSAEMWTVPATTFMERPGRRLRALVRFAEGDLSGFAEDVAMIAQHAQTTGSRMSTYMVSAWRAVESLLRGRLDDAAAHEDAIMPFTSDFQAASALLEVRAFRLRELGRLHELSPILEGLGNTTAFNWPVALGVEALHALDSGHDEQARELLDKLTRDVLAPALDSLGRYQTAMVWLEVTALLDDDRFADEFDAAFAPTAGLLVPGTSIGVSSMGAGDRMLGIVASIRRDWPAAERLFDSAIRLERSLPSPLLAARSEYWYARMLRARGAEGDTARAADLVTSATEAAERIGQTQLLGLLQ